MSIAVKLELGKRSKSKYRGKRDKLGAPSAIDIQRTDLLLPRCYPTQAFLAISIAYKKPSQREDKASKCEEEDPRIPGRADTAEQQSLEACIADPGFSRSGGR